MGKEQKLTIEKMEDNLNLEIRSKVLSYSLNVEYFVNELLLNHLAIFDKEKTKLFGNKAGISFKNKIDLLYDIEILTKEDHQNFELLMNFRNKFLHDIDCCSFSDVLKKIDNGIKNRFIKFIELENNSENEDVYDEACLNLYHNIVSILLKKIKEKRRSISEREDFLINWASRYELIVNLSFKLIDEIMEMFENSKLEIPEVLDLSNQVIEKCKGYSEEFRTNHKLVDLHNKMDTLLSKEIHKSLLK
jgi:hypothetical protein